MLKIKRIMLLKELNLNCKKYKIWLIVKKNCKLIRLLIKFYACDNQSDLNYLY